MMGLQHELGEASEQLRELHRHSISLRSGCELFLRFVTRSTTQGHVDFQEYRRTLIQRGEKFLFNSTTARRRIATTVVDRFFRDGLTVMVCGLSRCVEATFNYAAEQGVRVNVLVAENRWMTSVSDEKGDGHLMHERLEGTLPCKIVKDCAVAAVMAAHRSKDLIVLLGAEGVVENGGIISRAGHYQIALIAQALRVPVYIVAESYKFARMYPISQDEVPQEHLEDALDKFELRTNDFTPPELITLLFTDLGILTPAAVSDHLVQLYA